MRVGIDRHNGTSAFLMQGDPDEQQKEKKNVQIYTHIELNSSIVFHAIPPNPAAQSHGGPYTTPRKTWP